LAGERRTMVFFEAPHRVAATLTDMAEVLGAERPAALCRELTKTYEEVRREPLGVLAAGAAEGVLGEVTLVVEGAPAVVVTDVAELVPVVLERVAAGERLKEAVAEVSAMTAVPKRTLYDAAIAARTGAGRRPARTDGTC
jgi:16S rRNA (cytidine1402-2'-O)-methyltransferase